jgi:ATP-binding cassette subfamily F protein 3
VLEKLGPLIAPPKDDMDGMGGVDNGGQEATVYFTFPVPEKLSPPILQADEVVFGYDTQRVILNNVSFDLRMDSKIAIVGPNGAGMCFAL